MSQDNWNIGDWFQSALDALRGQPAPEEPPYIPPEAPPPALEPQPQGNNFFDQFQDWTTWDPGKGDWGGYHLDNGALPVVSGAGEMLNQWSKIPGEVAKAWQAPWDTKEPQGPADAADAWDTAAKAPDAWMTGLPFVDIPRLALDENLRKNWWEGLGKTAKAVGESVRQAEDSPVGGVVKGLESAGGATVAALGGAIMPLGIPAQGTEEFAGDISWNTFGSNVNIADPLGVNRFTRQGFLDDAARTEINKIRTSLPPDQRTAVDDYLSSKAYSGYSTLLNGVKAIVNGTPVAEAKEKHQDFLNELAGQIVFDPLNLIDVPGKAMGLTKTLDEMANVKAVGFAPLAGLTDETAKPMLAQAVRRAAAPESILDTPAWIFRQDPQALRQGVAEKASNVMDAMRAGLTDADAGMMPDRIMAFVKNDPEALVRTGGYLSNVDDAKALLNSEGGVYLRGMLKEIMTDDATRQLDPDIFNKLLKGADTVNGAVAAIMEKTVKAMDEFMPLADPASGVGNAAWEFYKTAIGKAKNIAAHIFVSTPGVWIGNIVGNELTQVVDRVRTTARLEGIEDALKARGIDIKRAYGGGLGGKTLTQLETTVDSGKLKGYADVFKGAVERKTIGEAAGKPIKESWGSWLKAQLTGSRGLEAYGEAEKAARTRAFYSAMMDWEREAAPVLVSDVAKAMRQRGIELGEAETFLRGAITDLNPQNISKRIAELRAKITKGLPIPPTVDSVTSEAAKTAVWEARKAGWDNVINAVNDAVAKHADDPAALKAELDKIRQGVIKQYNETAQQMRAAAKASEEAAQKAVKRAPKTDPKKVYKTQDGTGAVERWRAEQVSPEYVAAVQAKYGAAAAADFATQHAEMHTRAWDGFKEWADALEAKHRAKYPNKRVPQAEWEQIQDLKAQATRKIFARELAFLREAEDVNGGLRHVDPAKRYFENIKGFFARDDKPISEDELAAGKAWLAQNGLLPQGYVNAAPITHAEIATEARRVAALTDDAVREEMSATLTKGKMPSDELVERYNALPKEVAPVAQAAQTPPPAAVTPPAQPVAQAAPTPRVPKTVQPAAPAAALTNKDRFVTDLRQVVMALPGSPIKAEQVDAYMTLQDQLAETWAKFSGKSADEYYATLKAKLNPTGTGLAQTAEAVFYLQSQRAVEALKQERFTARELKGILDKNGVKAEERKWLGLDDLIAKKGDAGKVTKQEVIDFIRRNDVSVETRTITDPWALHYSKYSLPGGANYKEHVLTLHGPGMSDKPEFALYKSPHYDDANIIVHTRTTDRVTQDGKRVLFLEEVQSDWGQAARQQGFHSGGTKEQLRQAWDEAEGRYRALMDGLGDNPEWVAARSVYNEAIGKGQIEYQAALKNIEAIEARLGVNDAYNEMLAAERNFKARGEGVSPAPFVGDTEQYSTLALKRMLRYAADNGYDGIAWTTGVQQAERYSKALQEAVDTLRYAGDELVGIKNGAEVWRQAVPPDELGNYVGKNVAKTLQEVGEASGKDIVVGAEGFRQLYDRQLPSYMDKIAKKFGGKTEVKAVGIRSDEYQILFTDGGKSEPFRSVDDGLRYLREHPERVGTLTTIPSTDVGSVPFIAITPEMRSGVKQGLPLFNDRIGTQLGQYIPESRIIGLFDGTAGKGVADFETLVHETGHDLRAMLEQLVSTPVADDASGAFARLQKDYATFTEWATDGRNVWDTAAEEKFADGFTQFLKGDFSGVPQALHGIFQQIKEWLMGIIGKVDEPKLHPEVAAAYKRYMTQYPEFTQKSAMERLAKLSSDLRQEAVAGGVAPEAVRAMATGSNKSVLNVVNSMLPEGAQKFTRENLATRLEEAEYWLREYTTTKRLTSHLDYPTVKALQTLGVRPEDMANWIPGQEHAVHEAFKAGVKDLLDEMKAMPRLRGQMAEEDLARIQAGLSDVPTRTGKLSAKQQINMFFGVYDPADAVPSIYNTRGRIWLTDTTPPSMGMSLAKGNSPGQKWYPMHGGLESSGKYAQPKRPHVDYYEAFDDAGYKELVAQHFGYESYDQLAADVRQYRAKLHEAEIARKELKDPTALDARKKDLLDNILHDPDLGGLKRPEGMVSRAEAQAAEDAASASGDYGMGLFHSRPPTDDLHAIMDDINDATRRGDDAARLAAEERLKQFHGKAELHDALLSGKRKVADSGADALNPEYYEMVGQRAARFVDTVGGDLAQFGGGIPAPKGLSLKQLDAIEKEMQSKATLLRGKAQDYGGIRRDFALLDGKRRNFDWLMSAVYPFHYWYTRSYVNWGKRMLDNPRLPLSYMKVNAALEDINKDVPPQYRRSIPLDIAGTRHYFDWQAMLNPMRSLVDDFSVPEKGKTDFGKLLQAAGAWGSAPWQFWTWGYALSQAAKGDKESLQAWFNYALPSTRVLRAGTALAREAGVKSLPLLGDIPAGGIYPEEYLFRAFGIKNQGDMWEARRIGKALSDLLGETNPETGKPLTMTDITRAAYYREGAIWDMARQKAIVDQAGGTLSSFFGMRGMKLRPEDLVKQEQAQSEYYALQKSYFDDRKLTDAQYKDATKAFYEKYPWYSVYRMAKQNDMERVSTFTMDVLNRIPPGQRTKMQEDLGIKDFVDKFWAAKDRDAFLTEQQKSAPLAYKRFIAAVESLDGNYNIPSSQTRNEWDHFNALRDEYFKLPDRETQAAFKENNPLLAKYMPDTDTERFWRAYYALDPQGRKLLRDVPELKGINVFLDKGTRDIVNEKGISQIASATEQFAARLMETPAYQGWLKGTQQFGGEAIYDLQDAYFAISADDKAARAKFLQEHKELKAFWDWKDGYLKLNPILAAAFANKGAAPTNVAGAVSAGVPKDSANSTAVIARQKFGDDIYDIQDAYFEIPETDKAGRRAFLAENPKLAQYWEWRRAQSASSDPRLDQAAATIKKTMGADFANYMGIPFLNGGGGGGGGGAGRAYINAVRQKYTPNMTENEFIMAVGTRLKVAPYYQTQQQGGGGYSRAPQSVRYLVPFSRR